MTLTGENKSSRPKRTGALDSSKQASSKPDPLRPASTKPGSSRRKSRTSAKPSTTPAATDTRTDGSEEEQKLEGLDSADIGEADGAGIPEPTEIEILPAESLEVDLLEDDFTPTVASPLAPELIAGESNRHSDSRDIVRYDALQAYLREISRFSSLSREEEHDLALRYSEHKDVEAAYRLVASNLWLVVKIAREYEKAARSILDLIQEGNIGLMEAVKNFDPHRGTRLPSYAVWWIKAYIIRYVIANWRMVKIGTTQAQRKLFFNLKKEKEKLEREGFYAEPKLLAEKLHVKESEVVEMEQRLSGADISVDAPLQDDSDSSLLALLPSESSSQEELLAQRQFRDQIQAALDEFASTLNDKELVIFRERMLGEEKATLQDIAEQFSLSRERVRQIENRLRERLKEFLTNNLDSATLEDLESEA